MRIESAVRNFKRVVARELDKFEKASVLHELETFAHETFGFWGEKKSIRATYQEALRDRLKFRRALEQADAGQWSPLKGDGELPISDTEQRYFRKRGLPIPPVV